MKFIPILLGLAVSSAILSCKKDDNSSPASTDRATLLKAGGKSWKFTAATVSPGIDNGSGTLVTDFYSLIPACSKDDLIKFGDASVYTEDEGATKCNSSDAQSVTGTWNLLESNTKIRTVTPSSTDTVTIVSLTSSELKGSSKFEQGGTTYTITRH